MSALLRVDNLKKHYAVKAKGLFGSTSTLKAVDGVSFDIAAGQTLGIVGESGCGKSTMARLVLGALTPSAGTIEFEGRAMSTRFDHVWRAQRRRIQMVYQDPLSALDRRLSIGRQVMEPLVIHRIGTADERRSRALGILDAVGLPSRFFERFPHELSGGQRQRAVIARALILEPSLLVCDEPISALDVSVAAQVINLLEELQDRLDVSLLFISHDLKVVWQVSHDVAVMYLGRIVERGPPDLLFRTPAHPYTQALVSAIPTPLRRNRERILLAGDPPNPMNVPAGCPFHPRCRMARDICKTVRPSLARTGDGRDVACHLVSTESNGASVQ